MSSPGQPPDDRARQERRRRDYERFLTLQTQFEGARALYREGMGFSLVQIGVLKPNPDRLVAGIDLIPTRGLYNARPPRWPVSATWDTFGFTRNSWGCGYISLSVYFDQGLIEAVVEHAAAAEPEEYSAERRREIYEWILDYRRALLAKHRRQTLTLTWQGQAVAQLADHWLSDYPTVNSRLEAETFGPELNMALTHYSDWWRDEDTDKEIPHSPWGDALYLGWEVVTPDGKRFEASTPAIDFAAGRLEWRCGGMVPENSSES